MGKMTVAKLKRARNLPAEIACLEEEIRDMENTDKGLDHDTILDGRNGYPVPRTIMGFNWEKYSRKRDILNRKRKALQDVADWIDAIEDDQTRLVFRLWYIDCQSWIKIARRIGVPQNKDYPRICIRDAYLKKMGIR